MQDIWPFLLEHWYLSLAFVLLFVVIIYEEKKASGSGGFALAPATAVNLINREKAVVLDLRSEEQFKAGHIVDAVNVPFAEFEVKLKTLEKYQQRNLILVCPLNKSATLVMTKIRKAGFAKASLLAGSIDAWKKAELPLVKS